MNEQNDQLIEDDVIDTKFTERTERHTDVAKFNSYLTKEEMAFYYSSDFPTLLKKLFSDTVLDAEKYLLTPVVNYDTDQEDMIKEINLIKEEYLAMRRLLRELLELRLQRINQVDEALKGN